MTIVSSAATPVRKAVEDADILVVEVDVDVAVELAVVAEELLLGARVGVGEAAQDLPDVGALDRGPATRPRSGREARAES